ncbi:tetratricopeptide repeat protein [Vreelandella arcis]|uniref:TPR repeat n=1 Tax=Vreelandella arcis TaxID=416873 RepID=A0A1G9ZXS4_9GAMM|nr:tetratricopeptide repeat protein [Halomonas arcis]SDN25473.1 hypothetical protein SAMN04487951_103278 [Halomonas arcis]
MKKKILVALISVVVLIATGAATLGYFRMHNDEQRIAAGTLTDDPPRIILDKLDDGYLWEIRLLAHFGNASAQAVLGARYQYGLGVSVDAVQMLQNYLEAAEKGNHTAQLMLGRLYDPYQYYEFMTTEITQSTIDSVIKSPSGNILLTSKSGDAKNWYQRSAAQGNVEAMVMLGELLVKETRMADDNITEAAEWFLKAAENENLYGQLRIGEMYVDGYGVNEDVDKGIYWLKKAAEQGIVEAELALGMEYETGHTMVRDIQKAAEWYLLAAQHGNSSAQRNIGKLYANGEGVPRDYVEAYVWLSRAAAQGAPSAAQARDSLESRMTPSQVETAQRNASL